MKKVQNFNLLNLLFSLVVFIIGIILIMNSSFLIKILSWIIGGILGIFGIVKIISYTKKRKLGVDATSLVIGIILILFGATLAIFPNIVDVTIRIIFGGWILFAGINRLILAFSINPVDKTGFKTFLITSIIMIISGIIILISFYELLGILLVLYAIMEIIDYIYFICNKGKYTTIFDFEEDKPNKKIKQEIKEKEAIEAVID